MKFPGYSSLNDLLAAASSDATFTEIDFLGNIYPTLLNEHKIDEDVMKNFFYEFARALMIHKVEGLTHLTGDTYTTIPYETPDIMKLPGVTYIHKGKRVVDPHVRQEYADYVEFATDYLVSRPPTSINAPIDEIKRRAIYHQQFTEYLVPLTKTKKYYRLSEIVKANGPSIGTIESKFLFPQTTRKTLANTLSGVDLTNLYLYFKLNTLDIPSLNPTGTVPVGTVPVEKRIFICLCDTRYEESLFTTEYPSWKGLTLTQFKRAIITSPNYQALPTHDDKARVLAGMFSIMTEPNGELGHLDVMRFFGQQLSFDQGHLSDGHTPYWRNIHFSPRDKSQFEFNLGKGVRTIYGKPAAIDFLNSPGYPHIYPSLENHKGAKKNYITTLIAEKEGELLDENILVRQIKILRQYLDIYKYRVIYFENVNPSIFVKNEDYDNFKKISVLYKQLFEVAKNYSETGQSLFMKKEKHILDELKKIKAGTQAPNLPLRPTSYLQNFKKELKEKIDALNSSFPQTTASINLSTYVPHYTYACEGMKNPIDYTKVISSETFTKCASDMHTRMLIILNENFSLYFKSLYPQFKNGEGELNKTKLLEVCKYASIQTISMSIAELIEDYLFKNEELFDKRKILSATLYILTNLDIYEYSLINKGEKYSYEFDHVRVPINQRRLCLLLNILYYVNEIKNNISEDERSKKKELTQSLYDDQTKLTKEVNKIKGEITVIQNNFGRLGATPEGEIIPGKKGLLPKNIASIKDQKKRLIDARTKLDDTEMKLKVVIYKLNNLNEEVSNTLKPIYDELNNRYMDIKSSFIGSKKLLFSLLYSINKNKINDLINLKDTIHKLYSYKHSYVKENKILFSIDFYITMIRSFYKWLSSYPRSQSDINILHEILQETNTMLNAGGGFICKKSPGGEYFVATLTTNEEFLSACPPKVPKEFKVLETLPYENNTRSVYTVSNLESTFNTNNEGAYSEISSVNTNYGGGSLRKTRKVKRSQKRTRKNRGTA